MILDRFFKPKWQHADPNVRKQALQGLDATDPILVQLARHDQHPEVRRVALTRITDLAVLRQAGGQDPDGAVREFAVGRWRELMSGGHAHSLPLAARIEILATLDAVSLRFFATRAKEAELRARALNQLNDEVLYGEAAINDPAADVRLAALERVRDPAILEQLVRQSRNRDKRTYRIARERLDALRGEQNQAARVRQLGEAMAALVWDGETGPAAARFLKLEQEWRQVEAHAESSWRERYEQARARFQAERQAHATKKQARMTICARLENFLGELQEVQELTNDMAGALRETLDGAERDWQSGGPLGDDAEARRLEQRYDHAVQALQALERELQRNHERAERLRAVLREAETLLNQTSEVLETDITGLKRRWIGLERPPHKSLASTLQGEFDALVERLRVRLRQQGERREQELHELQDLLAKLEATLEEGKLQQAIDLADMMRQRLRQTIGLSRSQIAALETRLQSCSPTLGELRGWRRWGTNQAREHLCEAAENLIGANDEPALIAERIKELRAAWKKLEGPDGPAVRALWKRFDKGCEQAYEPCQVYFDALAQERQQHLTQRQELCQQLEHAVASAAEDSANWAGLDRLWREAQRHWHKLGPVNRADRKTVEQRYRAALIQLDELLKPIREREVKRRRDLIERLQDLAAGDDLAAAINAAKRAQADWHPIAQSSPREEQDLWRRFRTLCDAVFARREMEQQSAEARRRESLDQRLALCMELETLAETGEDINLLCAQLEQGRQRWNALEPLPRGEQQKTERRFAEACKRVEQRAHELRQAETEQALRDLRERAAACARVEEWVYAAPPDVTTALEEARRHWLSLAPIAPAALMEKLQRRFDQACRALTLTAPDSSMDESTLARLEEAKQGLCLRLEILAGVDSPPEFAEARMRQQVSRLADSLTRRDPARTDDDGRAHARRLEEEWYCLATLPPDREAPLAGRFQRVLDALQGDL